MISPFSIEQLQLLYGKTKDLVFFLERIGDEFIYFYVNPAAENIFSDKLIGNSVASVVPPETSKVIDQKFSKALETGTVQIYRDFSLFTGSSKAHETELTPITAEGREFVLAVTKDVTSVKQTEEEYLFFKALMKQSVDPMLVISADETVFMMNSSFEETFNISKERAVGRPFKEIQGLSSNDIKSFETKFLELKNGRETASLILKNKKPDGTEANFLTSFSRILEDDIVHAYYIVSQEFTEELQLKEDLKLTHRLLESYQEALDQVALVVVSDPQGIVRHANQKYIERSGFTESELIGMDISSLDAQSLSPDEIQLIRQHIAAGNMWRGEIRSLTKKGEPYWVDAIIFPLPYREGEEAEVLSIRFDITEKKKAEESLRKLAFTDSLTKLPNRRYMMKEFEAWKEQANAGGLWIAALFIDGDNFKCINDEHGHETGDEFIYRFGQALLRSVRTNDLVGRIGGDEFLIIINGLEPAKALEHTKRIIGRIEGNLQIGWHIKGHHFTPTASIGAAFYPKDALTLDELVNRGDAALLEAKKNGKSQSVFYADNNG